MPLRKSGLREAGDGGRRRARARPLQNCRRHRPQRDFAAPAEDAHQAESRVAAAGERRAEVRRALRGDRQSRRHRAQLLRPRQGSGAADPVGADRIHEGHHLHQRPERRRHPA
ncbi:MAG: hypothetical protein E6H47_02665, partial [Betaproteobacteria bacterium]